MNTLDQIQTIDDYFREFSHFHVRKATELLRPLHTPGRDSLPDFSDATRQPFEGQAHVIAAAVKMLDENRGMIVAEPGSGKTLMGMLTISTSTLSGPSARVAAMATTGRSCSARTT
jgi:superfamily II DNA or RNA helicase